MRLNLIAFIVLSAVINVAASVVNGQQVTLQVKNAPITEVFSAVEKQTGYDFWYEKKDIAPATRVTLNLKNTNLVNALDQCFKGLPLSYTIVDKTIFVKTKPQGLIEKAKSLLQDIGIKGKVVNDKGEPMPNANVNMKGRQQTVVTDKDGNFSIEVANLNDVIVVRLMGYQTVDYPLNGNSNPTVILKESHEELSAVSVVNTGYQSLPKERATGSFVQIDNELLNRRVSTNILERIDGIAPGVFFNGTASKEIRISALSPRNPGINIRGQSTINAPSDPLIVLDNFPYEGEISNINPNDIESITILRDGAAASIWGARAGNGVIVITSKKGAFNQKTQIELNTNLTIGSKPDLYYDKNYLASTEYIEVEKLLFDKGLFNADILNVTAQTPVSPVIDILTQQRSGIITPIQSEQQLDVLRAIDVRKDFEKYVYQQSVKQQYALSIRGGAENISYSIGAGLDKIKENVVANEFDRKSLNINTTYRPLKKLEIIAGLNYNTNRTTIGNGRYLYGSSFSIGGKYNNLFPYAQLADADGNALAIVRNYKPSFVESSMNKGFLDWYFRPLNEIRNSQNYTDVNDVLLRLTAKYQIIPELTAAIYFQNEKQQVKPYELETEAMYNTRNLINRFSQYNASTNSFNYIFPKGDILTVGNYDWNSQSTRFQLDFNKAFDRHQFNAIAGAEIRELVTNGYTHVSYGYNDQFGTAITNINYNTSYPINPSGSSFIAATPGSVLGSQYRYSSYYANAGYTYNGRYTLTLSGRKDGANIFGAKTNDKVTPLWSAGLSWDISKEEFYKIDWLPYLKLRTTFGYNGNVYNGSAYLTGTYTSATFTGAPTINISNPPNPQLRWEKVRNSNIGIDFATKNNIITGSIELYQKDGMDLLQRVSLPVQTGFTSVLSNSASNRTRGIDLSMQSKNISGQFKWATSILLSTLRDKLLKYDVPQTANSIQSTTAKVAIVGKSLYSIYSYKWAGLDPLTGDPRGYLNGQVSTNYTGIINNFNPDSLVYHGTSRPGLFGNLRNDFNYKGFNLSINISYKFNYFIRKPSTTLNYQEILGIYQNVDYSKRWQKPGDESTSDVPSLVYPSNTNRNTFYQISEVLVRKGDHIRLQDLRVGFDFPSNFIRNNPFQRLQLYGYLNNLGIIWRSNKDGIDPDNYGVPGAHNLPNPFTVSLGINAKF